MRIVFSIILCFVLSACGSSPEPVTAVDQVVSEHSCIMPEEFRGIYLLVDASGNVEEGASDHTVYDARSMVFPGLDNRHPYGDIIIQRKNGQLISASWKGDPESTSLVYLPPNRAQRVVFNGDKLISKDTIEIR